MQITKKEISENIKSKSSGIKTYYEYSTTCEKFSVNTFKFDFKVEQIEDETYHGRGFCATKKEFINFLYNELNK